MYRCGAMASAKLAVGAVAGLDPDRRVVELAAEAGVPVTRSGPENESLTPERLSRLAR